MKEIEILLGFSIPIGNGESFSVQVGGRIPTKLLRPPSKGTRASKRKKKQQKLLPPSAEE